MQRRSHRKSRFGCKSCKRRRMKVHPICGNCMRHGIPCDFMQIRTAETSRNLEPVLISPLRRLDRGTVSAKTVGITAESTSSSSSQHALVRASKPGSPASSPFSSTSTQEEQQCVAYQLPYPTRIGTPSDRLFELKLFHNYMQMTALSIQLPQASGHQNGLHNAWKQWVARLAMEDHTLMNAVLGFSATNLRAQYPSDRLIAQASYNYMLRAISSHAEQIRQGINDRNAEVLFATSTFMALYSWMTPPGDIRGPPLHWFRPYQGTRAIAEAAGWERIPNIKIKQHLKEDLDRMQSYIKTPHTEHEFPFDFLLDGLHLDDNDAETNAAYQQAVAHLNMIDQSPMPRYILRFPAMVSRRFVALLAAEDPRTLTIVGYFFMLLRSFGGLWWVREQATTEFKALMRLIPDGWRSRMDWAVRFFEQESMSSDPKFEVVDC